MSDLQKNGPRPVYAIDGEERALVDEFVEAIKQVAAPPAARDFNFESLSGKDVGLNRVVDAALTLPAFAERRLVIVHQAEKLNLSEPEPLLRYLDQPSPTTVLVLVADKFDGRGKVYKAFQRAGAAIRFSRPRPREMPGIIETRAARIGLQLEPGAVRMLVDVVGPDITAAVKALELLDLYRGDAAAPVATDDVAAVVHGTREDSIFDLVDAIGHRDQGRTLHLLHRLVVAQREPGLRVLAMIARHFRQLLAAREMMARGAPPAALASALGMPPFLVDKLADQARRFDEPKLVRGHGLIKHADRTLKSSRLRDIRILERLTLELMTPP